MASRLGNRYLRPTAANTPRSTNCPAQPPPPWRQRPTSPFSLALSVHGIWARFSIACGAFDGAFLACGSPAPEPPAPPPHDLLRTVSAARPRLCSASGSVGDHDLHALSLTWSLWEQTHYPSLSLACASLFLLGHSSSRGASLSLFAPGWIGGALRLVFVEACEGVAPCLVGKTQ